MSDPIIDYYFNAVKRITEVDDRGLTRTSTENIIIDLTSYLDLLQASGAGGLVPDPVMSASRFLRDDNTWAYISGAMGLIRPTVVMAMGPVTGSNLSGTNTGDQTISLLGDVMGSGTGIIFTISVYSPANSNDWASPPPTTTKEALDRCAALLKILNKNVGP